MGRKTIMVAAVTLVTGLGVTACADPPEEAAAPRATAAQSPPVTVAPSPSVDPVYAVGSRELHLRHGEDRPLRTVVLYPAEGRVTDAKPRTEAGPAEGRFPIVLFSHGLHGSPERYVPAAASWASAGFVVAVPAYPYTSTDADDYDRDDIRNQPADAEYVISKVRGLDTKDGDLLRGHVDGDRVAAIGHSAGGYTTAGLFTADHDPRLKAGIVLAGWLAPGAFAGPPADMLFLQGDADPVVPVADGRKAFDRVPWPKSYILLPRNSHAQYMLPGKPGYDQMDALVTDFLRWTLNDDEAAHLRMPPSDFPTGETG
jgi:dienelactone hydrolase